MALAILCMASGLFAVYGDGVFADESENIFHLPVHMAYFGDSTIFTGGFEAGIADGDQAQIGFAGGCAYLCSGGMVADLQRQRVVG